MSGQSLTYESVLELIREGTAAFRQDMAEMRRERQESAAEFDRKMAETREQMAETDRIARRTSREVGKLSGSMGRVIERMVGGKNIIKQFQEKFGYVIDSYSRNKTFGSGSSGGMQGEIDLFLENGEIAILISVKTKLRAKDVYDHTVDIEKFRHVSDMKGDTRRFIGAVAGAVVEEEAIKLAHENGLYVIAQSGKTMDIVPTPDGFQAKEW